MEYILDNDEYVLGGHPDRITDGIAETIAMALYNLDGLDGRAAVEAVYTGDNFTIGGEFKTSLPEDKFQELVKFIINKITIKQRQNSNNSQMPLEVYFQHQIQSPELTKDSELGWTDNCIAYGYYNIKTNTNKTPQRFTLQALGREITKFHSKELPDGKLIAYNNEITISIEEGIDRDVLEYLDIIKPTIFKKSGANADSGTVGRKLIAERHGNGVPHGGGAFAGKDFTKADKSFKLLADYIAQKVGRHSQSNVLVQLSIKHSFKLPQIVIRSELDSTSYPKGLRKKYKRDVADILSNELLRHHLYTTYAPTKPSDFLDLSDILHLERKMLELSGKEKLRFHLW